MRSGFLVYPLILDSGSIGSTRMQLQRTKPKLDTGPFEHGGSPPGPPPSTDGVDWNSSWQIGTSAMANGVDSCT